MDPDSLETKLTILLAKYDIQKNKDKIKNKLPDSTFDDISEIELLRRENAELKKVIDSQKDIIDVFRTKYLDISLEYNEKIDRIRQDHQNELKNLHTQFQMRLKV